MRTTKEATLSADRALQAYEMRKQGHTYQQIGDALGITAQGAFMIVNRRLKHINAELAEDVEEMRRLEVERLDRMLVCLDEKILDGDVQAVDKALKVGERRARLLGLDAPQKVAPTDPSGDNPYQGASVEELRALAVAIAGQSQ